jgi:hypothetical protein
MTPTDNSGTFILLVLIGFVIFICWKNRKNIFDIFSNIFKSEKQKEMEQRGLEILLEKIKSGKIHQQFIAGELPLELSPEEKPSVILPYIALLEPRAVRISRSNWGGPSFRVTKGLWFRTGNSYSTSESHEELRLVDNGTLAVTNQRLVFVGKFRTVNVKLNKIVGVDVYEDAIGLHFEGKEKARYFQPKFSGTVDFKDGDLAYSVPFEAPLLKAYIEAAINHLSSAISKRHGSYLDRERPTDQ